MRTHSETKISEITVKKLETVGSSSSAEDAAIKMRDKQISSVLFERTRTLEKIDSLLSWK